MNPHHLSKKTLAGMAAVIVIAAVLVACGGGNKQDGNNADSAQTDSKAAALALNGPKISWSPTSITDTAAPGTQQSIPVTFVASTDLSNVVLSPVPALQGIVKVTPSVLPTLQKGQVVTITLTIAPAATAALGLQEGTIHARVGSSTIAQPLPIQIIIATGGVGILPPDPGEAGKATLAGIDSNNNGVRDDVERYIWLTYPQSEKARTALSGVSKVFQGALLSASQSNASSTTQGYLATASAIDCLWYVRPDDAETVRRALFAQYLNTKSRSLAYVAYMRLLSGVSRKVPDQFKSGCTGFNPDTLPN